MNEEIQKCEKDSKLKLKLLSNNLPRFKTKTTGTKYTPIAIRQEKPYVIYWLLKKYEKELTDSQIAKLVGSTKSTVSAIRNGTYREAITEAKSPIDIGLCTYETLQKAIDKNKRKKEKEEKEEKRNL